MLSKEIPTTRWCKWPTVLKSDNDLPARLRSVDADAQMPRFHVCNHWPRRAVIPSSVVVEPSNANYAPGNLAYCGHPRILTLSHLRLIYDIQYPRGSLQE